MKKLSKKTLIKIGFITAPVIGLAIGIPVAINQRTIAKTFNVKVFSANGPRYFITEIETSQNRPRISNIDIWDITKDSSASLKVVAKKLGTTETLVTTTIKSGKAYSNGLEKLIYDLMQVKNNASDLYLEFRSSYEIGKHQDPSDATKQITKYGSKQIKLAGFPALKNTTIRAQTIRDWITLDQNVTFNLNAESNKYEINIKNQAALIIQAMQSVEIVDQSNADNPIVRKTTLADIKKAFNKIKDKLKLASVKTIT